MSQRAILQELADFDTPLLANTIGHIDPTPAHEFYMAGYIQSVTPTLGPTVGVAVTCEIDSCTPGGEPQMDGYWQMLEHTRSLAEPSVWVVKCVGSRPDHECTLGDGMAKALYAAGCVGMITDGGVRDVPGLLSTGFAAYSRGRTVHHCALRYRTVNRPVEIGGITVDPGDVIHANVDGVIKIPQSCLENLASRAIQMRAVEHEVHHFSRRTDLSNQQLQNWTREVFDRYGFGPVPRRDSD